MLRTLIITLSLLSTAAAPAQPNPDLSKSLHNTIARATYGQFWGAVLITKDNTVLLSEGFGIANQDLAPVTADSLFELASVSTLRRLIPFPIT